MASIQKQPNGKWRARYRDPAGKERAKHLERKVDAQRWLDEVTTSVVTGQYVDPTAGRVTLREYAEQWRAGQVHRPSSAAHVETMLRRHVYPTLGDKPLSAIRPSEVQAWVKRLSTVLAPSTVQVVHGILASVFKAAIQDRRVAVRGHQAAAEGPPEGGAARPRRGRRTRRRRARTAAAGRRACSRNRATAGRAARAHARPGRLPAPYPDRGPPARHARERGAAPRPPKTLASYRTVPLPSVVLAALAEHLDRFPASAVPIMWRRDGQAEPIAAMLLFTDDGGPWHRSAFGHVWRPAANAVASGARVHDLRHFYASLLIRHNESVKTVQARLGHATAAETLDTYRHLWPDSDDRTRDAVDSVLSRDRTSRGLAAD